MALLVACVVLALLTTSACSSPSQDITVPTQSADDLARAKLAAEIRQIEAATDSSTDTTAQVLRWAPFLTVLVAIGTLAGTYLKQRSDDRAERQKVRAAEESERQKADAQLLATTVENLGSSSGLLRVSTIASLGTSLKALPPSMTSDLLTMLVASARVRDNPPGMSPVLVSTLQAALTRLDAADQMPERLSLTDAILPRIRLRKMQLNESDVAFAVCTNADLSGCELRRVRGYGVDFSGARLIGANLFEARFNNGVFNRTNFAGAQLVSATFKNAALVGAKFKSAELQAAHFESADCRGAEFQDANVADTWFCNFRGDRETVLDLSALRSLSRAENWPKAHFSARHRQMIEALSQSTAGNS